MKSIHEIRRENLKEILRRYFDGKQIRLAERLEIQQNLVSRWESGAKNIGDKVARRIEEAARVESHWLDVDHQLANMLENQESDTGPTNTSELAASILKKWMDSAGLSQQKVAAASGVSQATINRLLRNESSISVNNLAAIAESFGRQAYEMILPPEAPGLISYDHKLYAALPQQEKDKIRTFIDFVMSQNQNDKQA
ncbi:helix-turn-helix transcriptional regulator [Cronobacter sakazakii]|uniref:helix-turn-helix domain-containing protein n=1 Tax=Cronobacter sakazakii TaxID=28141 RepID=UPI00029C6484|nr:helix-turn-helix transcriptional regulator [Cronobacter sakazakii]CCJ88707.1 putative repressor protein [Cronobacter turicensis 564]EGT4308210.1 XRE family transcriptional regulator [Cronobacter sakazakii]ELY2731109.1 helix-turn-helix transcriptional regulator [Cronobacter sakazakii]ELY4724139.1 helix-turn-helix transcriptional regulator [Cronobacter sakazakii]MDT3571546.1 helix-turn-helix transcriptional regulator [Cronobacter sakazakii]